MQRPDLSLEQELWASGYRRVAGLDEAGRGAWAGPVVAAAVVLPPDCADLDRRLDGVRDSKQLTARQRGALLPKVLGTALAAGLGLAPSGFIDRYGIVPATRLAMHMALRNLALPAEYLLIDAVHLQQMDVPQRALFHGDALVLSIAAASIVAKVFRDHLMIDLDRYYPMYGFASHKGYGVPAHRAALANWGPCPAHRMSFAPLRARGS